MNKLSLVYNNSIQNKMYVNYKGTHVKFMLTVLSFKNWRQAYNVTLLFWSIWGTRLYADTYTVTWNLYT